jgi:peptidoglycan/xylan/chitin deacetylase (PgdA/CDA1 family)
VLWNVDSKDYICQSPNEVLANFQRRPLCGGDLVLMHDNLSHAAEVLPHLVEDARKRGLTFTTAARWAR